MLHLHQYILNLLHFLYSITYGWNLEIGRVYFQRFRCACLTVFLFSLLGWSQLSWTAFSSSSSEIDWVLPWRWTPPSRLRIYATWKLGKPFVQEWVFFLSHLLTVLTWEVCITLAICIVVTGGSYFQPLSWSLRLKVALDAAKGLAFLHSAEAKVIYRDFKTSNILLDSVCELLIF